MDWSINGSRLHTPSAQLLVDLLVESQVSQLGTKPTRYRLNQIPSVLGLIIISEKDFVASLEYLNPVAKSDHLTFMANIQLCCTRRLRTITVIIREVTDFKTLEKQLNQVDWESYLSAVSISENWNLFKTTLSNTST